MGQSSRKGPPVPDSEFEKSAFDPNFGFPNGRKERVMIATLDEMKSTKMPKEYRGYCSHLHIKYNKCMRDYIPRFGKCDHILHQYHDCQYEDTILRKKEYEREKRLLARAYRIEMRKKQQQIGE